jgi:two-component system phosphate regulon sensor histidine kinase PhoR
MTATPSTRVALPPWHRFSWKLFALIALPGLLAMSVGGAFIERGLARREQDRLTEQLVVAAVLLRRTLPDELVVQGRAMALQPLVQAWGKDAHARVTVIDGRGVVLADSERTEAGVAQMEPHGSRPEVQQALQGGTGIGVRHSSTLDLPMLYVAIPLRPAAPSAGVLRVARPLKDLEALRRSVRRIVSSGGLLAIALAWALAMLIAHWVARPLTGIAAVAGRIAAGDLTARASETARDEIGAVGRTLNAMAEELRRRLGELEDQRDQARAMLESMAEGVCALDADGRVLWMNPTARELFQLRAAAPGQRLTELVRQPELESLVREVLTRRRTVVRELHLLSGQERAVQVHAAPCGTGGSGAAMVLVAHDVTEIRRLERVRREFVANVSHELKTPLTSIQGLVETLLSGAVDDAAHNRRFLAMMQEDAQRLGRLIDDLLELSHIESKAQPLRWATVELAPFVARLLDGFDGAARQRRVALEPSIPRGLQVRADPDRLRQVLVNLIDNAIKYNREGGAVRIAAAPDGDMARVEVTDTGIGIPEADLPRIFERFYRVDKARSRELGGTGLGLAIVKHIVESHGGQVTVASRLQRGSTFSFTVPLQRHGA